MKAMIFAAGLGTRLRPLTDTLPKALVKVGGKPMLQWNIEKLIGAGITNIVVNVHHFPDLIREFLAENNHFGIDIRISDETEAILDTGGGLKKAAPLLAGNEPIVVHNVDVLSNLDLNKFLACLGNPLVTEKIRRDYLSGQALKIKSTPTIFIGDRMFVGKKQFEEEGIPYIDELLNPRPPQKNK